MTIIDRVQPDVIDLDARKKTYGRLQVAVMVAYLVTFSTALASALLLDGPARWLLGALALVVLVAYVRVTLHLRNLGTIVELEDVTRRAFAAHEYLTGVLATYGVTPAEDVSGVVWLSGIPNIHHETSQKFTGTRDGQTGRFTVTVKDETLRVYTEDGTELHPRT
ncbi:hypothetical protein [Aeromicrobium sp. 179-A 4D2 NHS]|uniref:hypothetical protein n=1 Tax=Aeromicrobium sp. 179-A 4D2 NHS TaxID=3142375 RepID=UPI0039A214AC